VGALSRPLDSLKGRWFYWGAGLLCVVCSCVLFMCTGCNSGGMKRPVGFVRLGPAAELAQRPETFFSEARVLVRYDGRGFSAMSTACTQDLSALTRIGDGPRRRWVSSLSSSAYDDEGRVIAGPTKAHLPFYELKLAAGTYGGVPDTLFVEIGMETESAWRLPFGLPR
jgi:hypothetical protein